MMPRGPRKGDLKSQKILLETSRSPSGETVAQRLEKSASRALPGTSQYASRTVPAMLFACSGTWLRPPFFITFSSLLAPFLPLWAPKWRPGAKKGRPKKTIQNCLPKSAEMSPKCPPTTLARFYLFGLLGGLDANPIPDGPRDPIFIDFGTPKHKKYTKNT